MIAIWRKCCAEVVITLYRYIVITTLPLITACTTQPSREELAALAARGYYTHLIQGDYQAFLDGRLGADTLSANYREQLTTAYKQFAHEQQLRAVSVRTATTDSVDSITTVFLILHYADSTQEEVAVPMTATPTGWRMR